MHDAPDDHESEGGLVELRTRTVELIDHWQRLIETWTSIHKQALAAGHPERAARAQQRITECEVNVRASENRLEELEDLIDSSYRVRPD